MDGCKWQAYWMLINCWHFKLTWRHVTTEASYFSGHSTVKKNTESQQRNQQSSASLVLCAGNCWESTHNRWISHTNNQKRGQYFMPWCNHALVSIRHFIEFSGQNIFSSAHERLVCDSHIKQSRDLLLISSPSDIFFFSSTRTFHLFVYISAECFNIFVTSELASNNAYFVFANSDRDGIVTKTLTCNAPNVDPWSTHLLTSDHQMKMVSYIVDTRRL